MKYIAIFFVLFLCGCTTYSIVPNGDIRYHNGVKLLDSSKKYSKVRVEIAQEKIGSANDIPLTIFVIAQNLSGTRSEFSLNNISLHQASKTLPILSEKEAKASNFDFKHIVESYGIFIPQKNSSPQHFTIPFIYSGYLVGFYHHSLINARSRMQEQVQLEDKRLKKSIIISNYMRKNTLDSKEDVASGFILIDSKHLNSGEIMLNININNELHSFTFTINKK